MIRKYILGGSIIINCVLLAFSIYLYTRYQSLVDLHFAKKRQANVSAQGQSSQNRNIQDRKSIIESPGDSEPFKSLKLLASTDLDAAIQVASNLKHKERQKAYEAILDVWIHSDYRGAWAFASKKMPETPNLRYDLMRHTSNILASAGKVTELAECWSSLSNKVDQLAIMATAGNYLDLEKADVPLFIEKLTQGMPEKSAIITNILYGELGKMYGATSPDASVIWASSINKKNIQNSATGGIIDQVIYYDGLNAGLDLVSQMAGSMETDMALGIISRYTSNTEDLLSIAESIDDAGRKNETYKKAAIVNMFTDPVTAVTAANNISDQSMYFTTVSNIVKYVAKKDVNQAFALMSQASKLSHEETTILTRQINQNN